jgi:hypothetical protein
MIYAIVFLVTWFALSGLVGVLFSRLMHGIAERELLSAKPFKEHGSSCYSSGGLYVYRFNTDEIEQLKAALAEHVPQERNCWESVEWALRCAEKRGTERAQVLASMI